MQQRCSCSRRHSASTAQPLAGSDVDGDGKPEILVYAHFANDYGISLLSPDAPQALYECSCGNI